MTLNNTQHLDFEQLVDFVEGNTAAEKRNSVRHHLEFCVSCSDRYKEAEQLLALMKTDDAIDPPRDVTALAMNLFTRAKEHGIVRRLVALLSFDSLASAPAFGVRSSSAASRQLLYSADETEIDLRVSEENGKWVLTGQVLGTEECPTAEIKIAGENISESATLNDFCEFKLPPIPSGDYKLTLLLASVEVEVPRLELRS